MDKQKTDCPPVALDTLNDAVLYAKVLIDVLCDEFKPKEKYLISTYPLTKASVD